MRHSILCRSAGEAPAVLRQIRPMRSQLCKHCLRQQRICLESYHCSVASSCRPFIKRFIDIETWKRTILHDPAPGFGASIGFGGSLCQTKRRKQGIIEPRCPFNFIGSNRYMTEHGFAISCALVSLQTKLVFFHERQRKPMVGLCN